MEVATLVLMLVLTLSLPNITTTRILVFNNGKKVKLNEGYEVQGQLVVFKNKTGQLLQLPVKIINLDASEKASLEWHRKRKARLAYKTPVKTREALPDDLFQEKVGNQKESTAHKEKRVFNFADQKQDPYKDAWSVYEQGRELLNQAAIGKLKKELQNQLEQFSKVIWNCRALEKHSKGRRSRIFDFIALGAPKQPLQ